MKNSNNIKIDDLSNYDVLWLYQERLVEVYKSNSLNSIAGLSLNYEIDGVSVFDKFLNVTSDSQRVYVSCNNSTVNFFKLLDDIFIVSDEVLHFLGLSFMYFPYVNNPLHNRTELGDSIIYPWENDLADKRFFMYASSAFEKIYNLWNKIMNVLALFFPENNSKNKRFNVSLSNIQKIVPKEYHSSQHFQWLLNYKNELYGSVNNVRKDVVHFISLATIFKWKHIDSVGDKDKIQQFNEDRKQIIESLKIEISNTREGFLHVLELMEVANPIEYSQERIEAKRNAINNER